MKVDNFSLQIYGAAESWAEQADNAEIARSVFEAEERPDLANIFRRYRNCFRELEGITTEFLGLYTEDHGGEG